MTEHEELLKLRSLIQEQQKALEAKDRMIEKQNIRIENMIQALLHARKKLFGPSTEATKAMDGQLSLFETAQELAGELKREQKKITVPAYTRKARQPGIRGEMLSGLVQEIEEYIIPETDTCTVCGSGLVAVGKRVVRTEVEFVPAKLIVKQIVQQIAKCSVCGRKESEQEASHFQKAAVPKPPLAHSLSTPSLIAQVMYQKFVMGLPFARQEKDWYRRGLYLSRADMANWIIRCSGEWLEPIYDRIHEKLLECQVLHMDETRIQCNKEEGKKASSESFMWVMRSAECERITAAFFYYSRSRNGGIAQELLAGFRGYLITDAYDGYNHIDDVIRVLCWAHCRRYYIESIPLDNNGKELAGSRGAVGREYINCLFKIEAEIKDLPYEEKRQKRQDASKPILDAFWSWVDETSALKTTNEKLTLALNYSKNQRYGLEVFLKDGRLPLSNNLCEANIKPYATARRAWLFADSPKGARANGLDVYEYLKYLLAETPNNQHPEHPEIIDRYLPWSPELPEECRLKHKSRKCLNK